MFDWITHAGRRKEREREKGGPFYGCVVRRTATAKHKNPFGFLQWAALMSRESQLESGMELELRELAVRRGATSVVLKLIAKQKGMRATTAYPDHVRINNKRSSSAPQTQTISGKISKIRSQAEAQTKRPWAKLKENKAKNREREKEGATKRAT